MAARPSVLNFPSKAWVGRYRRGHLAAALEWFARSSKTNAEKQLVAAMDAENGVFTAMALHRMGRTEEASRLLATVTANIEGGPAACKKAGRRLLDRLADLPNRPERGKPDAEGPGKSRRAIDGPGTTSRRASIRLVSRRRQHRRGACAKKAACVSERGHAAAAAPAPLRIFISRKTRSPKRTGLDGNEIADLRPDSLAKTLPPNVNRASRLAGPVCLGPGILPRPPQGGPPRTTPWGYCWKEDWQPEPPAAAARC
jgi:hypothetical protein